MKSKLLQSLVATGIVLSALASPVAAAGTASFSLSPNSGNRENGSNFTVTISETGTDVNVVTAKLSFDPTKLACVSVVASAAFPNGTDTGCGSGTAKITRYTDGGTTVSGTKTVGTVTLKALQQDTTASVQFAAGSQIVSNGVNTWNGATAGGTYTLIAPVLTAPTPSNPTPSNPGTVKSANTAKTGSKAGTTVATTAQPTATNTPAAEQKPAAEEPKAVETTTETKPNQANNAGWILGGVALAAALGAGLYLLNKRAQEQAAAEAAAAAAAAKKAKTAKKPVAKKAAKTAKAKKA